MAVSTTLTILGISYEVWQRIPARDKKRIKKAIVDKNIALAKRIVAKYRKKKGNPDSLPRFKVIHCRVKGCGKTRRFDRNKYKGKHVPASEILAWIRRHRKNKHPKKFKEMQRKARKTKRAIS